LPNGLSAAVLTDLKTAATFPNGHRLHAAPAGIYINERSAALLREADVILSLDWVDLGGTLKTACGSEPCEATIIHASLDQHVHNGWSMDHQILPPVDRYVMADPDVVVSGLLDALEARSAPGATLWFEGAAKVPRTVEDGDGQIGVDFLAQALRQVASGLDLCLVRVPSSWSGDFWLVEHPLDVLGYDGGGGLASGPGLLVGAALALRGTGVSRLPFLGTAISSWVTPHSGRRRIAGSPALSWLRTIAPTSTTSCTRSASPGSGAEPRQQVDRSANQRTGYRHRRPGARSRLRRIRAPC
jgi:thiamine pyrophosphate-dependent acetolactate synthase large subunit-like protein